MIIVTTAVELISKNLTVDFGTFIMLVYGNILFIILYSIGPVDIIINVYNIRKGINYS